MSIVSENVKKHFVGHKTIGFVVEGILEGNPLNDGRQSNRETLDDIIHDLTKFRNTLPTVEEYTEEGRL
jgi:hypothetical protein